MRRSYKIFFSTVVTFFVVGTIVTILFDNWETLARLDVRQVAVMVAIIPIGIVSLYLRTHTWREEIHCISKNTVRISWADALWSIGTSRLGRYTPGGVAGIALRAIHARSWGLSSQASITVSVADTLMDAGSGLAVLSLVGIFFCFYSAKFLLLFALITSVVLIISLCAIFRTTIHKWVMRIGKFSITPLNIQSLRSAIFACSAYHILRGVSFVILLAPFSNLSPLESLWSGGAFIGANLIAMVAIFTPAGFGIVELSLFAGMSLVLPIEIALFVVALARVWDIAVDLLFALLSFVYSKATRPANLHKDF
jgi:hypothetical protein